MPRYLDMLRAKNIFGNPRGGSPLGMPDIDDGNVAAMFRSVVPLASSLKKDDMKRAKEMMEFEASLRRRQQPQPGPVMPQKKNVVYGGIHPPTTLQRQFREDDVAADTQKNRLATLGATQTGALNNALITGKQRDDADMARTAAEINGRSQVAQMNKEMAAKAADDARKDKDTEAARARLEKGQPLAMDDPNNPGQKVMRRFNPATNTMETIKVDSGGQAGRTTRMGIDKTDANPGQDPVKLAAVRKSAQSALNELDQLVDADGSLKTHTSDAVGKSRIIPDLMDRVGMGSFTPSTTKGREGLKSLKAKLVIDLIGQMKAQSKTGATGFGAMNRAELAILEDSASKLSNRDLSDEDFKAELGRVKERLKLIMQDATPGSSGGGDRTDELIRKYGG